MESLLKLEFRRLTRKKSFYICTSVMFSLLLLAVLLANALVKVVPSLSESMTGVSLLFDGLGTSSFTLIAGIFAVLFVCEDYSQQTVKNIYARGYSQKNVYFAKLISTLVAATVMFLAVELFAFLLGTVFFGVGEVESPKFFALLAAQYVAAMAEIVFAFAIASVLCKTGASIATMILAPLVVSLFLSLTDAFLEIEDAVLTNYWMSNFLSSVSVLTVSTERLLECLFGSFIYIVVFIAAGLFLNKRIKL